MTVLDRSRPAFWLPLLLALTGCSEDNVAVPVSTEPTVVYQQLLKAPLATATRELQASVDHQQPGYSNYLRFRLEPGGVRELLHAGWRTVACEEIEQRLVITDSDRNAFKPPWNPVPELSCRCFEGEFETALGPGHYVMLLDETGLVHLHAASR